MVRITMAALCFLNTEWTGCVGIMLYTCFGSAHFEFDPENHLSWVRLQDVAFSWLCGWWFMSSGTRCGQKVTNLWVSDTALCTWRSSSWLRFFMVFSQSFQAISGTSPRLDNCHFFPNYIVFSNLWSTNHPPIDSLESELQRTHKVTHWEGLKTSWLIY